MLDVFGNGIVAGAFFFGGGAVHPAAERLDPSAQVLLRQELIRRLARYMLPFMSLPIVTAPAAMMLSKAPRSTARSLPIVTAPAAMMLCQSRVRWVLDAVGLVLSLATVGITVAVNAPLNRRFVLWSADAVPPDWQKHIGRWNAGHVARMTTALAAFVCTVLAGT